MMRLSTKLWGGLVAGVLLVGLPGGAMGLDGGAIAQTMEHQQSRADRLLRQGLQQFQTGQFQAALHSWEQALAIYRSVGNRQQEAVTLNNLGFAYNSLGQYEKATNFLQQQLDIVQEIGDRQGEATSLGNLGIAYYSLGQYERAIGFLRQQFNVARGISNRQEEAAALNNLGLAYNSLGQHEQAIESYQQAFTIAQEIGDRRDQATSLRNIGLAYDSLGQYEEAIEFHQQSLIIMQEVGDRYGESQSYAGLGNAYSALEQYEQAVEFYQQSLVIKQEIDDQKGQGKVLNNLGLVYHSLGQHQKAIDIYQQSLDITRKIGDRQGEVSVLSNMGNAYDSLGQYEEAIRIDEQYLAAAREIGDRQREVNALGDLGLGYAHLGRYEKAIDFFHQSISIAREIDDRRGEAKSFGNLGNVYNFLGQYEQAIDFLQQHYLIAQEIGDLQESADALGNLGNVHVFLGQYETAINFKQLSLNVVQELGDRRGQAMSLANLGGVYSYLGQYEQAIDLYNQSLAIGRGNGFHRSEGISLGGLGHVYQLTGQYQQAIDFLQQSLVIGREIGDRRQEGTILGSLGSTYLSLGQYEEAIDFYQQSLDIAKEIGDREGEGVSLNNLGAALLNRDRAPEAEQQLLAAAEIREAIRADVGNNDTNQVSLFDQQTNTYRNLQRTQIAQNKTIAALETAERGRARAFVELLHRRLNPDDPNATIAPPNLAQIQQIAQEQNATLVEYSIIYDLFDLDDNPGKEATRESALYIWVIPPTGEVTFRQVDLTPLWRDDDLRLHDLVQFTRDSLGVRGLDLRSLNRDLVAAVDRDQFRRNLYTEAQLLTKLHEILIAPIADLLPENPEDRVVFLPQSSLFLVPFPALMDANGDYLIEKHTILTAPSIQTLELTRSQKETQGGGQGALIVGNPTMPSVAPDFGETPRPLSKLPGAETEALEIAQLLNTQAFTGNRATKSAMVAQMQDAEIIHLATHGLLDDIRGMGSAIALAPDSNFEARPGEVNGLLTAEEIFDMDLKADLVVLSACDTGRGRITGDGVVGLSRSFISAGVPTVLVSLWQVPDAPTADLMTRFYQQRESLGDNAQALRQAMLQTMQTHPEPRNWAAFTLIGEAD